MVPFSVIIGRAPLERISFFSGQEFVIFVSFHSVSVVIFFTEDIYAVEKFGEGMLQIVKG